MDQRVLFVSILVVALVAARPIPGPESDLELAAPRDPQHNGYAFWWGLPFYDQDDDGDNGSNFHANRRPNALTYAEAGAGWGR